MNTREEFDDVLDELFETGRPIEAPSVEALEEWGVDLERSTAPARLACAVSPTRRTSRGESATARAHLQAQDATERQRALPTAAVATLDNGVLRRASRPPRKSLPPVGDPSPAAPDHGACEAGPSLAQPAPAPAAPEFPPEADRLAVPEAALEGDAADV